MASLSAFIPRIAYRVDGCPDPTIKEAVLDSCIEFCEKSQIVRQTLDPLTVAAGTTEIDVEVNTGTKLVQVIKLFVDGSEIHPLAESEVGSPFAVVGSIPGLEAPQGTTALFFEPSPGVVRILPPPEKEVTVTMRVAVKPSRTATAVDDVLFEDWAEAIVDGALMRLFATQERFSNGKLADYHSTRFRQAINAALVQSTAGRTRADLRVRSVRI